MKPPWCPWCFDDCANRQDALRECATFVSRVPRYGGARGQTVTPWDNGGWRCTSCQIQLPPHAWALAMIWVAKSHGYVEDEYQKDVDRALG